MSEIGQIVAIGTHHDTMPSTSRAHVHESEMKKFAKANDAGAYLLKRQYQFLLGGFVRSE